MASKPTESDAPTVAADKDQTKTKTPRRRSPQRRRKSTASSASAGTSDAQAPQAEAADAPKQEAKAAPAVTNNGDESATAKKETRPRRRGGKRKAKAATTATEPKAETKPAEPAEAANKAETIKQDAATIAGDAPAAASPPKKTRRGKRGGAKRKKKAAAATAAAAGTPVEEVKASPVEASPPAAATPPTQSPAPAPAPVTPPPSTTSSRGSSRNLPFGFGIDDDVAAPPPPVQEPAKPAAVAASVDAPVQPHADAGAPHDDVAHDDKHFEVDHLDTEHHDDVHHDDVHHDDEHHDAEAAAHARLVLKPRPPRRARGGRRRRKKSQQMAGVAHADEHHDDIEHEDDDVVAEVTPIADAPEKDPSAPAPTQGEERGPKRRRSRRKKVKAAPVEVAQTDDDDGPDLEPVVDVIDLQNGEARPLQAGREMIINMTAGAECRIAILDNGRLEELYLERQSSASHVGNIYMGRVTNVEPSIQAAFVDFGLSKNGFLHISDVLPKYFPNNKGELEQVGKKVPRRDRPPIQKCFRRGDKVIVQVVKEGVGTKGPTLTTYLSIPGRFMVMMPGMDRLGVSRKIEDDQDRRAMRELLEQLNLTPGVGFILRTAGLNRTKRELQSDLNYLTRLWRTVEKRTSENNGPCELYQESDLVIRTIRDVYSSEFKRIVVDDMDTAQKAREFLRIAMPRTPSTVTEYRRPEPIFHAFGIEQEIERIHSRHVPLKSGGSIVIDSTEAMVAIDVNSGKFRDLSDAEETAFRINLEAAEEIARQLRLRDLGGLVVCDFIDLRIDRHKRAVEKALRDALKKHKERARILRMSKFGLIEMTRQRQRQSIKRSVFVDCPHCKGGGLIKAPESMSLEVIRILQLLAHRRNVNGIVVRTAPAVATLVLNERRAFIHQLETQSGKDISILPNPTFASDQVEYDCTDDRGMPIRVEV